MEIEYSNRTKIPSTQSFFQMPEKARGLVTNDTLKVVLEVWRGAQNAGRSMSRHSNKQQRI